MAKKTTEQAVPGSPEQRSEVFQGKPGDNPRSGRFDQIYNDPPVIPVPIEPNPSPQTQPKPVTPVITQPSLTPSVAPSVLTPETPPVITGSD